MIEDYTLCHDEIAHVVEMMYTSRMRLDYFEGNVSHIESFFKQFRRPEVYERRSSRVTGDHRYSQSLQTKGESHCV